MKNNILKKSGISILLFSLIISMAGCAKEAKTENSAGSIAEDSLEDTLNESNVDNEENIEDIEEVSEPDYEDDSTNKTEYIHLVTGMISILDGYDAGLGRYLLTMHCPVIKMDDNDKDKYPQLDKALKDHNKELEKHFLDEKVTLLEGVTEERDNNPDYVNPYTEEEHVFINRADSNVLSLRYNYYSYTGGAHGMYGVGIDNFDVKTGNIIELKDVVKDIAELTDIVKDEITSNHEEELLEDADTTFGRYLSGEYSYEWSLDYDGITVYFNPYDIAPYACGMYTVFVPYAGNENLFTPSYFVRPTDYALELNLGLDYDLSVDPDRDGKARKIAIYGNYNEYMEYDSIHMVVDDMEYNFACKGYEIVPIYIYSEGKEYIYTIISLADENQILQAYRIDEDSVTGLAVFDGGVVAIGDTKYNEGSEALDTDYMFMTECITDPTSFYLGGYEDFIGTELMYRNYKVGSDGRPEATDECYYTPFGRELTISKQIEGTIVDEKGTKTDTVTLEVGTTLSLYRTDRECYLDFIMRDGTIVRIDIEVKDNMIYIDGTNYADVLDGVIFVE